MAIRSTNTYQEGLQSLVQDVASMMLLPDANPDFLNQMQAALVEEANAPLRAQAAQAAGPPPAGNAQPLMPPPPGGAPMGMPAGGPLPGSAPLPGNRAMPDELARMLQ